MKQAIISIDLQPGMEIMSEEELKSFIRNIIAKDLSILGKLAEVSIREKQ